MWSKRKEDELPGRPDQRPGSASTSTSAVEAQRVEPQRIEPQRRESNSMTSPSRSFEPESSVRGGFAALGKNVTVKGQIFAREDLTIDGEVEGTVECHEHRLTIGPNARVQAGLKAREIIIQGSIHGNVDATDKIDIKKEAKLVGDIKTSRIVIEDGAYFKGSIDISKPAAAAKPVAVNAAAPVTSAPQAAPQQSTTAQPANQPQPSQAATTSAGAASR